MTSFKIDQVYIKAATLGGVGKGVICPGVPKYPYRFGLFLHTGNQQNNTNKWAVLIVFPTTKIMLRAPLAA